MAVEYHPRYEKSKRKLCRGGRVARERIDEQEEKVHRYENSAKQLQSSLHVKKLRGEEQELYQARINRQYRLLYATRPNTDPDAAEEWDVIFYRAYDPKN